MIYLYSGTPGSGKSLHVVYDIYARLRAHKYVIANFPLNFDCKAGKKLDSSKFIYIENNRYSSDLLYHYSKDIRDKIGLHENNILLVLDESQLLFNSRSWQKTYDAGWIQFFSQHRKLGYNVILVAQNDRMIDRQIRSLVEYEVKHRKVNNFKWLWMLPFNLFIAVNVWYGIREKNDSSFFLYSKCKAALYDTFAMFEQDASNGSVNNA